MLEDRLSLLCIQRALCEGLAEHANVETLAFGRSGFAVNLDSAAVARLSRLLI